VRSEATEEEMKTSPEEINSKLGVLVFWMDFVEVKDDLPR
jgi:hypothetical protein